MIYYVILLSHNIDNVLIRQNMSFVPYFYLFYKMIINNIIVGTMFYTLNLNMGV